VKNALKNNNSQNFNDYFGFNENPFSETYDINFFFLNEANKKRYQELLPDIYRGVNLTLLIAEQGVGKTAFLQQLIGLDPFQLRVMYIQAIPGHDLTDVLYSEIIPTANSPDTNKTEQLIKQLTKLHQQGISPILIVDDAQLLTDASLEPVLQLSKQLCEQQRPLLQLILAADPTFPARFDTPSLLTYKPSISRLYHLNILTLAEVRDFINFRLRQAGCTHEDLFSNSAVRTIATRSKGIPRLIIKLCREALQQAAIDGEHIINEKTIAYAAKHLFSTHDQNNHNFEISNIVSQQPTQLERPKKIKNQPVALGRLVSLSLAAIALLTFGAVILLNIKPEKKPAIVTNLNTTIQPKLDEENTLLTFSAGQVQKNQVLQTEKDTSKAETQLAGDKAASESLKTEESTSKTLLTEDQSNLANLDTLITKPTKQSPSLIAPTSLNKPKLQLENSTELPKTAKSSTQPKIAKKNQSAKRELAHNLDKRERLAKQRSEARLKLHQSGISFGIESLMAAAASGDNKTMELLLTGGVPADIQEQTRGFTALAIAAGHGHNDIIKLLVLKSGASVNLKNFKGRTALMIAAESGHADTVDFLLSNGAKANLKDKNGWTALMFAAYNNHLQTAHILLDWGANAHLKNNAGRTAMQIARSRGNLGLIKMVTQKDTGKTSASDQLNLSSNNNPHPRTG